MAESSCRRVWKNIFRTKRFPSDGQATPSELRQTLSTLDLTLLGIGSMMGAGLYVVTGVVAKDTAGPAIIVSYLIAGVACMFAALCYAEIAGMVPHTGSAYTFTYIALGEIWALFIGWSLFLEYILSAASVGRAMSGYVDDLCGHAISNATIEYVLGGKTWNVSLIAEYPDILGGLFNLVIGVLIILGASVASWVNMLFLSVNVIVICIIFGVGMKYADIANWEGNGGGFVGFAPFGVSGVIAGAAMVFYAFVGFDVIAMSNEEARTPKESIPRASYIAVIFTVFVYAITAAALTLMIPYTDIDMNGAFTGAFDVLGVQWAKWAVGIGAVSGMTTTNLASQFCGCRLVYAISKDGLLFSYFAKVNQVTRVPIRASLLVTFFSIVFNVLFDLEQLVAFLSIGTLGAYLFVSYTVIILRYHPATNGHLESSDSELSQIGASRDERDEQTANGNLRDGHLPVHGTNYIDSLIHESNVRVNSRVGTLKDRFRDTPVIRHLAEFAPGQCVSACLAISLVFQFAALAIAERASDHILAGDWWAIVLLIVLALIALVAFLVIPLHQQGTVPDEYYSIDWVPLVPGLSILSCVILALELGVLAWLRFFAWLAIGLVLYVCYGYRHSTAAVDSADDLEKELVSNEVDDNESRFYGSTTTD